MKLQRSILVFIILITLVHCFIENKTEELSENTVQPDLDKEVADQAFSLTVHNICRKGFRLDGLGNCRKVLGGTTTTRKPREP